MQPGKSETIGATSAAALNGGEQQPQQVSQGQQGEQGQQQPAQQSSQDGGRLYAGRFKTVEEMEQAFLASQQTQQKSSEGSPATIDESGDEGVKNVLTAAGLNQDEFTKEFEANGDLSEDSYKKLEKHGFPREMVQVYVEGLKARQSAYSAAVYGPAGGEQGYNELIAWAKANLNAEQKRAFNEAVTSGDVNRASLAVQGLVAMRGGNKPQFLNGKATSAEVGPQPFKSQAQVVEAMRDPRYRRDPAYRKEVADRLRVSPVFR